MSDQNTKEPAWPKWAPEAAREVWRKTEHGPTRAMLGRLLTDPNKEGMQDAWGYLKKEIGDRDFDYVACICVLGFLGPIGSGRLHPSVRQREIKKISSAARGLAVMLEKLDIDTLVVPTPMTSAARTIAVRAGFYQVIADGLLNKKSQPTDHDKPMHLSSYLREFASNVRIIADEKDLVMPGKPNSRKYFVRYLVRDFLKRYQKRLPQFVIPATRAALEDRVFNQQQFYTLTKSMLSP